jgi:UDPglucose--hexose-1-phosphate uridylyltransferase
MLNEFRQDPVSGDWVLFSAKRADRPGATEDKKDFYQPKESCPFENKFKDQEAAILLINQGQKVDRTSEEWTVRVFPNKYPVVAGGLCSPIRQEALFQIGTATGSHELVVTRDHDRHLADLEQNEIEDVILAYFERFQELSKDECSAYVSIFHNQGHLAGASIYHSHSQIFSMPIVPSLITRSIERAETYFKQTNHRIYEDLIAFEAAANRVIFENDSFVVFCPFASRTPFEIRIFPKEQQSSFEQITRNQITQLAEALSLALKKLNKALNKPDYIFFLRTAPLRQKESPYRWHIEIMPRQSIIGGVELGSDMFINSKDPDESATLLRETSL